MKFFHTSDWHLGRMLYGRSLLEDQQHFLEQVFLPAVERERPDAILLSGDSYDRQVAPPQAIRLFDQTVSRLAELSCKVFVIAGNHDGADRLALCKNILRGNGIYFGTSLEDVFSPVLLEKDGERVQLFLLPYFDPAVVRDYFQDDSLKGMGGCMERIVAELLPLFAPDCTHILLAHCFAAGSYLSDSESTLFVGGSGEVATSLFDSFDYVALGHLHGPQRAGEKGRYSGSPLKYSFDEAGQKKGFLLVETKGAQVSCREIPVVPLRDMRRISGTFSELLEQGRLSPSQDYLDLTLTDDEPVLLAAERLRPYYPNLLNTSVRWASSRGESRAKELRNQDDSTLFHTFLHEICGWEPDSRDMALFAQLMEEVKNS